MEDLSSTSSSASDDHHGDSSVPSSALATPLKASGGLKSAAGAIAAYRDTNVSLQRTVQQLRDENGSLRREVTVLQAREVEMAALGLSLQQQFGQAQHQIDGLKATVRQQLLRPVTEAEFFALEQRPPEELGLVDCIKIGVFQQLGAVQASRDAAVRRGAELALRVGQLEAALAAAEAGQRDTVAHAAHEAATHKRQIEALEGRAGALSAVTSRCEALEQRLRLQHADDEKALELKMMLQAKTNEALRLELALKEAEEAARHAKGDAACAVEKLDILKAEYYEARMHNARSVMELESALRASEEKVAMLHELETEAEVFMANMASADDGGRSVALGFDVPASRRLHHTVAVTKRALALENQLRLAQSDTSTAQAKIQRLEASLEMARAALQGAGGPRGGGGTFGLVEDALASKEAEVDALTERLAASEAANAALHERVQALTVDVSVMARHRAELARLKEVLGGLGGGRGAAALVRPSSPRGPAAAAAFAAPPPSSHHARTQQNYQTPAGLVDDAWASAARGAYAANQDATFAPAIQIC